VDEKELPRHAGGAVAADAWTRAGCRRGQRERQPQRGGQQSGESPQDAEGGTLSMPEPEAAQQGGQQVDGEHAE
jgi:hypothetical protein